jgi:hypothetical protein
MSSRNLQICPDLARQIVNEWMEPMAENGNFDELMQAVAKALAPHAEAVARRILRSRMPDDPEVLLTELNGFLEKVSDKFSCVMLDPDAMAAMDHETYRDLVETHLEVNQWIVLLESRRSQEATVHPSAAVIIERGGTP